MRSLAARCAVSCALAASCARPPAAPPGPQPPSGAPITFVENDYPRALAEARARGLPLFVDAWAPWCHTCLSMRQYVFPDASLRRFADRFVWLSLDTEREENAPVVTRLEVRALPTLFVIDGATERVRLGWPGSMTAAELAELLDAQLAAGGGGAEPGHALAVDVLVTRASAARHFAPCVSLAADEAPGMPPGTALVDVLRAALGCAEALPKDAPERGRLAGLTALAARVVSDRSLPVLADDRSDLYDYVVNALRELGREGEARRVAATWATFLENEAARAPFPAARAVFDSHRLLAYVALGEPQRAIPMLARSERDFPDDYNPPARLGAAYFAMKRYDDALAALGRALERAYGPRKLRLWSLEADVLLARGDRAGAGRVLADAVAFARRVPLTGHYPELREALEKRLADLEPAGPTVDASPPGN